MILLFKATTLLTAWTPTASTAASWSSTPAADPSVTGKFHLDHPDSIRWQRITPPWAWSSLASRSRAWRSAGPFRPRIAPEIVPDQTPFPLPFVRPTDTSGSCATTAYPGGRPSKPWQLRLSFSRSTKEDKWTGRRGRFPSLLQTVCKRWVGQNGHFKFLGQFYFIFNFLLHFANHWRIQKAKTHRYWSNKQLKSRKSKDDDVLEFWTIWLQEIINVSHLAIISLRSYAP